MPFRYSRQFSASAGPEFRLVDDRRNNPVRGRDTQFRLLQQNMLAYTFREGIPGFATAGLNTLPFPQVVDQTAINADAEGADLFGPDYRATREQVSKVLGDIFEALEAAIHWNAAARWNAFMATRTWAAVPRYARPRIAPDLSKQVAALWLPRGFDWVQLLDVASKATVEALRLELHQHDLGLPTSTPDLLIVALPPEFRDDVRFRTELPNLLHASQITLTRVYRDLLERVRPSDFLLAVALKRSLRSDRLYQPLYEANVMQLLLEGRLGAPQVDFEVHTLESAGTRARSTYSAASLAAVATRHISPHRAVRDLYEPPTAQALVQRFLDFLTSRPRA